jgi:GGDEF domain-containing protein
LAGYRRRRHSERFQPAQDRSRITPDNAEFGAECLLDAKLARYDEQSLVITLPACLERDPIHSFAQYLHASLRTPMQILGEEMLMSPYVGISYYPNDALESAELIRRAMLVALHSAPRLCSQFLRPQT